MNEIMNEAIVLKVYFGMMPVIAIILLVLTMKYKKFGLSELPYEQWKEENIKCIILVSIFWPFMMILGIIMLMIYIPGFIVRKLFKKR